MTLRSKARKNTTLQFYRFVAIVALLYRWDILVGEPQEKRQLGETLAYMRRLHLKWALRLVYVNCQCGK